MLLSAVITSCLLLAGETTGGILSGITQQLLNEKQQSQDFFQFGMDTVGGRKSKDLHAIFTGTKAKALLLSKAYKAKLIEFLPRTETMTTLEEVFNEQTLFEEGSTCSSGIQCDPSARFRTADGTCNNLQNPEFGSSFQPFRRFVAPDYEDGVFLPRVTEDNNTPLPSPRAVSVLIHTRDPGASTRSDTNTHMLMQFAQFLDHDITLAPFQRGEEGSTLACCQEDLSPEAVAAGLNVNDRPQCFGIDVPQVPADRQFSNRQCLNFVRSDQVQNAGCSILPVEQLNVLTSFVDGSQIYGSTDEEQFELRTFTFGQLKSSNFEPELLPRGEPGECITPDEPSFCFRAGDERVDEHMALNSMHTFWLREHNRIARTFFRINPQWTDEKIFQETRRIVGAMLQKITFTEFLPSILSQQTLALNVLLPIEYNEFGSVYDPNVDATINNAFSTAAYRFGHSLIRSIFNRRNVNYTVDESIRLRNSFGNTSIIFNSSGRAIDDLTRGLARDPSRLVDRHISPELTDFLFLDANGNSLDLMSLNIQRGRDHGLPGYNAFRSFCGLSTVDTFSGMVDHAPEVQQDFSQLYSSPGEIDLFSAGISETPLPGSLLGPTFSCLVARQFRNLKLGDRFFYETGDETVRFTMDQLNSIRKLTLSRVICDNTDTERIQPEVFRRPMAGNRVTSCLNTTVIPRLDLELWRDPAAAGSI